MSEGRRKPPHEAGQAAILVLRASTAEQTTRQLMRDVRTHIQHTSEVSFFNFSIMIWGRAHG
ncbi:hypothetical protein JXQ70_19930 [bacterium]|nr:hypothetical protein [bacterium]